MSYSSWRGADCVITKITKQFTIWCPSHCVAHGQGDCSAVCRAGTNVVPSFGSGPCQVPAAESPRVGQWASLGGSPERVKNFARAE